MNEKSLLALMYDFYNSHTLKGQNDDINYYINVIKEHEFKKTLIIGAGTGRVAIPLSDYSEVTALDFDYERLLRLNQKKGNIKTVCVDFLDYEGSADYDLIIIPYSTLQFNNDKRKLEIFLEKLNNLMTDKTTLIFDVSESFNSKIEKTNELIFSDYCDEIKDNVEVYYNSKRKKDYIEFIIRYKLCDNNICVIEKERYYYYNEAELQDVMKNNNIKVIRNDTGYGKQGFNHKHLYHCMKK